MISRPWADRPGRADPCCAAGDPRGSPSWMANGVGRRDRATLGHDSPWARRSRSRIRRQPLLRERSRNAVKLVRQGAHSRGSRIAIVRRCCPAAGRDCCPSCTQESRPAQAPADVLPHDTCSSLARRGGPARWPVSTCAARGAALVRRCVSSS
jgi:hypothetical protein